MTTGSVILAGRRSWETPNPDKMETCDLLCVYNNSQINKLKTEPNVNMGLLQSTSKTAFDKEGDVEFFDRGMPPSDESDATDQEEEEEEEANVVISDRNIYQGNEDIVNVDDI